LGRGCFYRLVGTTSWKSSRRAKNEDEAHYDDFDNDDSDDTNDIDNDDGGADEQNKQTIIKHLEKRAGAQSGCVNSTTSPP